MAILAAPALVAAWLAVKAPRRRRYGLGFLLVLLAVDCCLGDVYQH